MVPKRKAYHSSPLCGVGKVPVYAAVKPLYLKAMLSVSSLTLWPNAIQLNGSHYVYFRTEVNQRQSVEPRKKFEKEQLSSL